MENILTKIVANTREELVARMQEAPLDVVQAAAAEAAPPRDFAAALTSKGSVAIIAEVKKASPSKGVIREDFDPVTIARAYELAGAAALSVLTDAKFFQGSLDILRAVRKAVTLPVLRKDFLVDAYQVFEARAAGADAVLLISEVLSRDELAAMLNVTRELGMSALVESHDLDHLEAALDAGARILGVNNRNLETFEVDLATTERLARRVSPRHILVSESGIATHEDVLRLAACGVRAVLVGETLMRAPDVGAKLRELLEGEDSDK